ncbi:MAG: DUF721 domain-containing protein [Puniceicoccales bacterium]|jgi:hypothetical protein|nr:DUF721 domain-containing protein [Puniceicoccales bacterium]
MATKKTFGRRIRNLIAAFRGLPPEEGISCLKKAKPIGISISTLLKKFDVIKITPQQTIHQNWPSIVGEAMAKRCYPVKILNNDTLVIHSFNAIIRSELQIQKLKILDNLHQFPNCAQISDIRFLAHKSTDAE